MATHRHYFWSLDERVKPLLKWPGGKRRLLKHILPLIPEKPHRYYEPFLGSGAVFLSVNPQTSVLSDVNPELITCYQQIQLNPQAVCEHLATLNSSKESYLAIRAIRPTDLIAQAARLIYLTTLSFNGIYRTNRDGQFNVPYGYRSHLHPRNTKDIVSLSAALARARIQVSDFEHSVSAATTGDVVYLDPPYTVAHGNNGFLRYNAKVFSWADQRRLARVSRELADRGCQVIISNADHPSIEELYDGFEMKRIERQSSIAASPGSRRRITECIYYNEV